MCIYAIIESVLESVRMIIQSWVEARSIEDKTKEIYLLVYIFQ